MSARVMMAGAVVLVLAGNAQAQPPMPSHYVWKDGANSIKLHLRKDGHSVADTATRTCTGSVDGPTKVVGRAVVLTARSEFSDNVCVLNITFNKTYTRARIRISKGRNCSEWHGASCGFDGPVLTRQ
jgi:hypothetical protein